MLFLRSVLFPEPDSPRAMMVWLRLALLGESCASKENVLKNLDRVVSLPIRRKNSFNQFCISFRLIEIGE